SRPGGSLIAAEVIDAALYERLRPAWEDLVARAAEPNAFMDPALVAAAAAGNPSIPVRVLVAWQPCDGADAVTAGDGQRLVGTKRLVGAWAFAVDRPRKSPVPLRMLSAPAHLHAHLATPVIDHEYADAALDAMLDAVVADPDCPNLIALDAMGTEGPIMAALARVLSARGSTPSQFDRVQ